jgi:hypothetical protein
MDPAAHNRWLGRVLGLATFGILVGAALYFYREDTRYYRRAYRGTVESSSGFRVEYVEIMSRQPSIWRRVSPGLTRGFYERGEPTGDFFFAIHRSGQSEYYETLGAQIIDPAFRIAGVSVDGESCFLDSGSRTILILRGTSATSAGGFLLAKILKRPNKSLQPTATAVMPPAAQEIMPAVAVAEH